MPAANLSLAEKIGQLFMVGFEGTTVTPTLADWMATYGWGGVIIFGRNVESPAQLLALTQSLQLIPRSRGHLPLLTAVDQEGGRVARLKAPFTAFPSAATLGATGSEALAYQVGQSMGRELRAVGLNTDMAPVLDVLTNAANTVIGDRAFSADPQRVSRHAAAFMRGMHAAGVLAVGKHFPGHGDTRLDSHVALPMCERSLAQLKACELVPFGDAIAAGLQALMTAHVVYTAWDSQQPATLSSSILTGVLRQEMGFQGVIISDDLGMAAVSATERWKEVSPRALGAGVDVLLICHHRQRQEEAYASVLSAVQCGALPESLLDRALVRVQALKSRLLQLQDTTPSIELSCIGSSAHQSLAASISEQSAGATAGDGPHVA